MVEVRDGEDAIITNAAVHLAEDAGVVVLEEPRVTLAPTCPSRVAPVAVDGN